MKKLFAIVLAIAVMFALCVPAMAVKSPEEPDVKSYNVTVFNGKTTNTSQVKSNETVIAVANETEGAFQKWEITGTYDIVEGSLTSKTLKVTPKSDLTINAVLDKTDVVSNPKEIEVNVDGKIVKVVVNGNKFTGKSKVTVVKGKGTDGKNTTASVSWNNNQANVIYNEEKNQVTVEPLTDKGEFNSWTIYVASTDANGKRVYEVASSVHDYVLVNTDGNKLTIVPLSPDLIICANYNGVTTSPKTGDNLVIFAIFLAVLSLAGISLSTKKILSK